MSRRIRINNFKSLVMEEPIDIKRLTFLFGRNGSGKSNFLRAIRFLGANLENISGDQTIYNFHGDTNLVNYEETIYKNIVKNNISFEYEQQHYEENEEIDFSVKCIFNNKNKKNQFAALSIINNKNLAKVELFPNELNENLGINNFDNGRINLKKLIDNHPIMNKIYMHNVLEFGEIFQSEYKFQHDRDPSKNIQIKRDIKCSIEDDYSIEQFEKLLDVLPFYNNSYSYSLALSRVLNIPEDQFKSFISDYYNYFIYKIPSLATQFFRPYYTKPIRNKPEINYPLISGKFEAEAYDGLINLLFDLKQNDLPFSSAPIHDEMFEISMFINRILKELKLAEEITLDVNNSTGNLLIIDKNGTKYNLAEASSGIIHILPILIRSYQAGYLYANSMHHGRIGSESDVVIVEQPELHLHPSLQADLAKFFAGGQNTFIIETHSEHMIRKIQVLIAKGELNRKQVAVYYFDKSIETGITSIKEMEIEDNGFFKEPWPDGFFDDSYTLAKELILARRN
jgi:predicted ATPase